MSIFSRADLYSNSFLCSEKQNVKRHNFFGNSKHINWKYRIYFSLADFKKNFFCTKKYIKYFMFITEMSHPKKYNFFLHSREFFALLLLRMFAMFGENCLMSLWRI